MAKLRNLKLLVFLVMTGAATLAAPLAESRTTGGRSRHPLVGKHAGFGKAVSSLKRHLQGQRGLDLKRVRVICEFSNHNSLVLSLRHRSQDIGLMEVMTQRDRPAYINGVFISDDSFKGKGLGSLLYLVAAKATRDKLGCDLGGSFDQTRDARKLWSRFKDQGLVYPSRASGAPYAFKQGFTQSNALKELFRQHYRDNSRPPR